MHKAQRMSAYNAVVRKIGALLCCVFMAATCVVAAGQDAQQPSGESTSRPQQPPTPPDAPIPDQGTQTTTPPESGVKRTLNKLDPHCINIIFHTCWSSPPAEKLPSTPSVEQKAANDIDVGYCYLRDHRYRLTRRERRG